MKVEFTMSKGDGYILSFFLLIVLILCGTWLVSTSPVSRSEIAQLIQDNGYFE